MRLAFVKSCAPQREMLLRQSTSVLVGELCSKEFDMWTWPRDLGLRQFPSYDFAEHQRKENVATSVQDWSLDYWM